MMDRQANRRISSFAALSLGLLITAWLSSAAAQQRSKTSAALNKDFVIVENGKGFDTLQAAVDAVGDARGTIRIASGTYQQCAVQSAGRISYVAAEAGGAIFDSMICESKAALVLRGTSARIDGVLFQNYRGLSSHVQSAIAWEAGALSIVNSLFWASDTAVMGQDQPDNMLNISQSSFTQVGRCAEKSGECVAAVDIGRIAKLRMTTSHFTDASVSVRALAVDLEDNLFEDGPQSAQPLFALPSGATGRVQQNEFRLHNGTRGSVPLIKVAQQGRSHAARGLVIKDNRAAFADGVTGTGLFIGDGSGDGVAVGDNHLGTGLSTYHRL